MIEGVDPGGIALPIASFRVWIIVVVPAGAPGDVVGIADVVAPRRLDVSVAEEDIGAIVVAVRRTGRMPTLGFDIGGFTIGVKIWSDRLGDGWHVANPNHIGRSFHDNVFDGALIEAAIDIAAEAELRAGDGFCAALEMNAPIIISETEERSAGDGVRVVDAAGAGAAESGVAGAVDVEVGVPGGPRLRGGTTERLPVLAHETKDAGRPNVVVIGGTAGRSGKAAGILIIVAGVHHTCDSNLSHVIDARDLFRARFGFRERREEHRGQDGNDRNDHEQLDKSEAIAGRGSRAVMSLGFEIGCWGLHFVYRSFSGAWNRLFAQ